MEEEGNNNKRRIRIILASASPRRKDILQQLKLDFIIFKPPAGIEKEFENPRKTVLYNSRKKAEIAYGFAAEESLQGGCTIIAGFDTVVHIKGKNIGKPQNTQNARNYLKLMSGRTHSVFTGITLINPENGEILSRWDCTKVKFRKLSGREIDNYLQQEYVFDKAAGYNISGFGSLLVERINGCFYNVAGFPVWLFVNLLKEMGQEIL